MCARVSVLVAKKKDEVLGLLKSWAAAMGQPQWYNRNQCFVRVCGDIFLGGCISCFMGVPLVVAHWVSPTCLAGCGLDPCPGLCSQPGVPQCFHVARNASKHRSWVATFASSSSVLPFNLSCQAMPSHGPYERLNTMVVSMTTHHKPAPWSANLRSFHARWYRSVGFPNKLLS